MATNRSERQCRSPEHTTTKPTVMSRVLRSLGPRANGAATTSAVKIGNATTNTVRPTTEPGRIRSASDSAAGTARAPDSAPNMAVSKVERASRSSARHSPAVTIEMLRFSALAKTPANAPSKAYRGSATEPRRVAMTDVDAAMSNSATLAAVATGDAMPWCAVDSTNRAARARRPQREWCCSSVTRPRRWRSLGSTHSRTTSGPRPEVGRGQGTASTGRSTRQ